MAKAAVASLATALVLTLQGNGHVFPRKSIEGKSLTETRSILLKRQGHERYVCRNGRGANKRFHCVFLRLNRASLAKVERALRARAVAAMSPRAAICSVFGGYCSQALRVVACETGGTFSVWATNGQYLGLFQMGSYARGRYGHSSTALGQARAAFAYFRDSGYGWGPWSCKP